MKLYDIKTTITVDKNEYFTRLATIDRTELGYEAHGIFTAQLGVSMGGHYVTAGGYSFDKYDKKLEKRVGTKYGMDFIIALMDVFGVSYWESIKGSQIYALMSMDDIYGPIIGFAHVNDPSKVLFFGDIMWESDDV